MIRLFAAIAIPYELALRLSGLRGQIPDARWVSAGNMHITLRFIGEIDEGVAADVDDALAHFSADPINVAVRGVGHFESRGRVRSLWAGVERVPALVELQARVELACQRAGLAPEGRKFHPHITLARCQASRVERVADFLSEHGAFAAPVFTVNAFGLYSSSLGRGGSVYTREVEYQLGEH